MALMAAKGEIGPMPDAAKFEEELQAVKAGTDNFESTPYLHRSCQNIRDVDLRTDLDKGQESFGFLAECEGMCGL